MNFSRLASTSHGVPAWSAAIWSRILRELAANFLPALSPVSASVEASTQPVWPSSFAGNSLPASVTVFAPSAAEADALSTAFYLLGLDGTAAYVEQHPEIGVVFVLEGAADRSPRIVTFGLGEADFTL